MSPYPVAQEHKEECGWCYGMGCFTCGNRGWHESVEGCEDREDAEERRADAIRNGEW